MLFYKKTDDQFHFVCEKCGKSLQRNKSDVKQEGFGYSINPPLQCDCGNKCDFVYISSNSAASKPENTSSSDEKILCPKCHSSQITANQRGFSFGKAVIGGALLGPIGLVGGALGNKKVQITCLKCGYQWYPGKE